MRCHAVCWPVLQVLKVYESLGTNVERADLWRYLSLHKYGGVYAGKGTHTWKAFVSLFTSCAVLSA